MSHEEEPEGSPVVSFDIGGSGLTNAQSAEEIAASVAEDAAATVRDRASHGDAVHNHRHIAEMWSAYLGVEISARNVADMMIHVKQSRAQTGEVIRDHYVDVDGYGGIAYACAVADGEVADDGE